MKQTSGLRSDDQALFLTLGNRHSDLRWPKSVNCQNFSRTGWQEIDFLVDNRVFSANVNDSQGRRPRYFRLGGLAWP